jgi:hypothetical protein
VGVAEVPAVCVEARLVRPVGQFVWDVEGFVELLEAREYRWHDEVAKGQRNTGRYRFGRRVAISSLCVSSVRG